MRAFTNIPDKNERWLKRKEKRNRAGGNVVFYSFFGGFFGGALFVLLDSFRWHWFFTEEGRQGFRKGLSTRNTELNISNDAQKVDIFVVVARESITEYYKYASDEILNQAALF